MKKIIILIILVLLSVLIFSLNSAEDELKALGEKYAAAILSGNFELVFPVFDAKMKEVLPKDKFELTLATIRTQLGELKKRTFHKIESDAEYSTIFYKCEFDIMTLLLKITLNKKKRNCRIFFNSIPG